MKSVRVWLLLAALTASTCGLFGSTYWQALARVESWNEVIPLVFVPPVGQTGATGTTITTPISIFFLPWGTGAVVTNGATSGSANAFYVTMTGPVLTCPAHAVIAATGWLTGSPIGQALSVPGDMLYAIISPTGPTGIAGASGGCIDFISLTAGGPLFTNKGTISWTTFTGGGLATYIAIHPTLTAGYVTTSTPTVYVIDTAAVSTKTSFSFGATAPQIIFPVISPTGSELYVTDLVSRTVMYVSLTGTYTTGTITNPPSATSIGGLCMAPNGAYVYNVYATGASGGISYYDLAQTTTLTTIGGTGPHTYCGSLAIPTAITYPGCPTITPDGQTIVIPCEASSGSTGGTPPGALLAVLSMTGGSPYTVLLTADGDSALLDECGQLQDLGPVAMFTTNAHGSTVLFDASLALTISGELETYQWDFGDGETATTTFPITSHTYSESGPFTTSLTVTNAFGDSSSVSYADQMIYNCGGFLAEAAE